MIHLTRVDGITPGEEPSPQVVYVQTHEESVADHENRNVPPDLGVETGELSVGDYSRGESSVHWKADRVSYLEAPPTQEVEFPLHIDPDGHNDPEIDDEDEESHQRRVPIPYREEAPELIGQDNTSSVLVTDFNVREHNFLVLSYSNILDYGLFCKFSGFEHEAR